jgi:hypothetical protein
MACAGEEAGTPPMPASSAMLTAFAKALPSIGLETTEMTGRAFVAALSHREAPSHMSRGCARGGGGT